MGNILKRIYIVLFINLFISFVRNFIFSFCLCLLNIVSYFTPLFLSSVFRGGPIIHLSFFLLINFYHSYHFFLTSCINISPLTFDFSSRSSLPKSPFLIFDLSSKKFPHNKFP